MTSQEKISVYALSDLKNTSDDAIPAYLNSLSFIQSHTLVDTRLALGYTAFAICAATFYWDYTLGFESTKFYTAIAVAIYTLLNGALTLWIWGVEKGIVYVGTHKTTGEKIEISTKTEKHVPIYNVTVKTTSKDGKVKEVKLKKGFNGWFDKKGGFVVLPFRQMFASAVEVIGKADPGKVVVKEKKKKVEEGEVGKSMEDKWASLLAESSGITLDDLDTSSSTATPSKGGKKRGKKA